MNVEVLHAPGQVGGINAGGRIANRTVRGAPASVDVMMAASPACDETRFRQTVIEHYPGLLKFLRRMGLPTHRADDVAQAAFLVAFERLPRLMVGSERAFVFSAAVRIAHSLRRGAMREVLGADLDRDSSPDPSPEDFAHQKRVRELFEALLDSIEREPRAVFVRFEVDGLTIPEIAEVLAISRDTATRRLRRARKQFRALVRHFNLA